MEIIPQHTYTYGDGVPAYKSGEWPGSKPSRFFGSKLILKPLSKPQKDFFICNSRHFPPKYSEEYKFKKGLKLVPPFIHNDVYRPKKRPLMPIQTEQKIYIRDRSLNPKDNINNPDIQFMKLNDTYYNDMNNIIGLIDNSEFDFIIFDYHLDVSKTVNDLKEQMSKIDLVLGNVATVCENKHTLIITSLYGLKKTLPLAQYNTEMVTIDYELQIPIFLFDYSYPRGKYRLAGGSTNDILNTALTCIWPNNELYSLIRPKDLIANLFGKK